MEAWEHAWLDCKPITAPLLPADYLLHIESTAERYLLRGDFRCIVEEWVSGDDADFVVAGILWSGFCLKGQEQRKRNRPIPVIVQLAFASPPEPADSIPEAMKVGFYRAFAEWRRGRMQYGTSFIPAP